MSACISSGTGAIAGVVLVYTYTDWRRVCEERQNVSSCFQQFARPTERHIIWHLLIS